MDLFPYIASVRAGVESASALADDHTRQVAERLGTAIESSTRLALIQALSDAAAGLSAELAPSSVELRMVGQDPEFAVTVHRSDAEPTLLLPDAEPTKTREPDEPDGDSESDEPVARVTLRLPQSVKAKVDERATTSGISTNAWLMRVVMDALEDPGASGWLPNIGNLRAAKAPRGPADAGAFFGPNGPFGEHGVFGPHGPFGQGRSAPAEPADRGERHSRGSVQGWVR
jgi:hypothetical protein